MVFQKYSSPVPSFFFEEKSLTQVNEYNFLGTVIDSKGTFKRGEQELAKKGVKVLFTTQKFMSNFNNIPTELSCKLFDILIRPILTYNSEVWFMDTYLPVYRALNRAEKNNYRTRDLSSLEEKSGVEKVHFKFCKIILGLKRTSTNIGVITELGQLPLV